jgi:hypothetical protein
VYIDKLTEMRDNLQTPQPASEFARAAEFAGAIRRMAMDTKEGIRTCE